MKIVNNWKLGVFGIAILILAFLLKRFPIFTLILVGVLAIFLIIRHVIRSENKPKTEKKDTAADDASSAEPYQMLKRLLEREKFAACITPKDGQSLRVDARVQKCDCAFDAFYKNFRVTVSFSDGFSCYTYTAGSMEPESLNRRTYSLSNSEKQISIYNAILEHNRLLCEAHPEYNVNELNREAAIYLMEAKSLGHRHVCSVCGNTYIKISAFTPCPFCEKNN